MEEILVPLAFFAIPIVAIVMNYWFKAKKMEHERLQMQQQLALINPQAAANSQASAEALKHMQELSAQLEQVTKSLDRMNTRLQNVESIVTSPSFLSGQGLNDAFHTLTEEQQAAELAKQIAAREGRIS